MLERWGRLIYRLRWLVLAAAAGGVAFAVVWGTGVFGALTTAGGFDTPGSDSLAASEAAQRALGRTDADVVVLYRDYKGRPVDNPKVKRAVQGAIAAYPRDKVESVSTFYSTHDSNYVSADRTLTYAVLQLAGDTPDERADNFMAVRDELAQAPWLTAQIGGTVATEVAINEQVSADIKKAESISLPVLLVLLVVIFGSLAAAAMPLALGLLAILGSFTVVHVITLGTDVSVYVVNITTFLGLGLAIDYGLFMVARFREELAQRASVQDAVAATMRTAGRTVLVSGLTVSLSLAGLILFPQLFLKSMGYGGVATVMIDMLAALTVLPALLAVLGPKINGLSLRRRGKAAGRTGLRGAGWLRLGRSVMRRPLVYIVATLALLAVLGAPFLRIAWGGIGSDVLPASAEARVVTETLDARFPRNATSPIEVVVGGVPAEGLPVAAYAERLGRVPGVSGVGITATRGSTAHLAVLYEAETHSTEARAVVHRVRDVPVPPGARVYVGGPTAEVADLLASIAGLLPWVALVVGTASFVLLFLAFGSVLLPIKAMLVNLVSLAAAFGAVVWIFQEGHLSGELAFTANGTIGPAIPVLMLAMLFGVSMDYEVFLLSRIREQYDLTGDNATAVVTGLQRTGGVITSAALLFLVAVGGFAISGISFLKLLGVGMVLAILVDATIVRAMLVPATMRLMGRANWWAPGPLGALYRRYGVREEEEPAAAPREQERVLEPAAT